MEKSIKNISKEEITNEKLERIERGKRIKDIRENELKINKTELGKRIGVSSQFIGLVEEGKGNLMYKSLKRLKEISGHSADYILYGIDDGVIEETREYIKKYSNEEIIYAMNAIKDIACFLKKE